MAEKDEIRVDVQVTGDQSLDAVNAKLDKLGDTAEKAGQKTSGMGGTIQSTGRIVQDFAQGGLGGIINNLEQFAQSIAKSAGAVPGLATAIGGLATVIGTAALIAYNQWDKLMNLIGLRVPVPDLSGLAGMEDALKKINKEIDTLRGQSYLDSAELTKHNQLLKERLVLEGKIKGERAAQKLLETPRTEDVGRAEAAKKAFEAEGLSAQDIAGGSDTSDKANLIRALVGNQVLAGNRVQLTARSSDPKELLNPRLVETLREKRPVKGGVTAEVQVPVYEGIKQKFSPLPLTPEERKALEGYRPKLRGDVAEMKGVTLFDKQSEAVTEALARLQRGDKRAFEQFAGFAGAPTPLGPIGQALVEHAPEAEEQRKADEEDARKDQAESDRLLKKRKDDERKAREKRTTDLAKPLQDRYNLIAAQGGAPTAQTIAEELIKTGQTSPDEAAKVAQDVLNKLIKAYGEDIAERAAKKGMTGAEAAVDLLTDTEEKQADKAKQKAEKEEKRRTRTETAWKKVEDEEEKAQREGVQKATALLGGTGADTRYEGALLRSQLQGGGQQAVTGRVVDQMTKELMERGMTDEGEARGAATEKVSKMRDRLFDELQEAAMKPDRAVESFSGAESLNKYIQEGESNSKKLLGVNEKMKDELVKLVQAAGGGRVK